MSTINKYWLIILGILLLTSFITGSILLTIRLRQHQPVEISISETAVLERTGQIYIDGAVACPGFYTARNGDTLESILLDAGVSPDADWNRMKLYIPKTGETREPQKVNLNLAEAWLISALPGIGPETAQAIVEYRNQHGSFRRIEDLLNVRGIGNTTLNRIKGLVTLEE